jgi:hypothetical protein
MTRRIESSWGENFTGRILREPPMGRQRGIVSQHFSERPKIKSRRAPIPKRAVRGIALPLRTSEIKYGAAIKEARAMRAMTTFWAVRFCTDASVRGVGMCESRNVRM